MDLKMEASKLLLSVGIPVEKKHKPSKRPVESESESESEEEIIVKRAKSKSHKKRKKTIIMELSSSDDDDDEPLPTPPPPTPPRSRHLSTQQNKKSIIKVHQNETPIKDKQFKDKQQNFQNMFF